uniref:Uncharacterized protein n=1 Tax=Chrysotila carterae TaxID=13221 RepID=A0A7S4BUE3_CHRCT
MDDSEYFSGEDYFEQFHAWPFTCEDSDCSPFWAFAEYDEDYDHVDDMFDMDPDWQSTAEPWETTNSDETKKSYAHLPDEDCEKLKETFTSGTTRAITFDGCTFSVEGCKILAKALERNETLTAVEFSFVLAVGDESCKALADMLKVNKTLNSIEFTDCCVGAEGCKALVNALECNTSLTRLGLRSCPIGDEGYKVLANALKTNTTLAEIDLAGNKYYVYQHCAEGVKSIISSLEKNTTLKNLKLERCGIDAETCEALGEMLQVNRTITHFSIAENAFGYEGCEALALALHSNKTLTSVWLTRCDIDDDGCEELADMLKLNKTLESLWLDGMAGAASFTFCLASSFEASSLMLYAYSIKACPLWPSTIFVSMLLHLKCIHVLRNLADR